MSEPVGVQIGRVCPRCGREDSIPKVHGLPSLHAMQMADRGLVALGGCVIPEDAGDFLCRACGLEWGREFDPTADEQALAELLGVTYAELVRALGAGWRRHWSDDEEDEPTHWFVSGEPAQVAVAVTGSWFVLDRPVTAWDEVTYQQTPDSRAFGRDDVLHFPELVAEAAEVIASRRRRSFRWCRSCRRAYGPESFVGGAGACDGCDSAVFPVDRPAVEG
jgi:hypothetical protein